MASSFFQLPLPLFTGAKFSMSNFTLLQHKDIEESVNTVLFWELNITTKYSLQCETEQYKQKPGKKGRKSDRPLNFPDNAKDKCQH